MQKQVRILIIEDDTDINEVLTSFLKKQGFCCMQAFSGSEARLLLEMRKSDAAGQFNLVITDLMLPGISGHDIVSLIRSRGSMPVIVISALDKPSEKVELFQLGADDYLVKPFDLEELLARVTVQLRHASKNRGSMQEELTFRDWLIDLDARSLMVAGTPVRLTRTEYNIIEALIKRPKKVFSKRELYEAVWNEDSFIEEKAINVHVSNIRAKLKETGTDHYIETVWGIGFRLLSSAG